MANYPVSQLHTSPDQAHLDWTVGGHLVAARVHHRLALRVVRPVADLHNSIKTSCPYYNVKLS